MKSSTYHRSVSRAFSRGRYLAEPLEPRTYLTVLPPPPCVGYRPGRGQLLEISITGRSTHHPSWPTSTATVSKEILAVGGDSAIHVYKFNGTTAVEERAFIQTGTPDIIQGTPVVVDLPTGRAVFAGNRLGNVYGWNASTGQVLPGWPQSVKQPDGSPSVPATFEVLNASNT